MEIDPGTLHRRLDHRLEDELGAQQSDRDFIVRLHRTKQGLPKNDIPIDATAPPADVVAEIVRKTGTVDSVKPDPG